MEPHVVVILLRWLKWFFSLLIFGVAFAFFLYDVNAYVYIPAAFKAQVALAGFLHIYMYIAAVWASCVRGLGMFWAVTDIAFAAVTIAVAGLSQPSTAIYCVSQPPWPFNSDWLAYVPPSLAPPNPPSYLTFSSSLLHLECGFFAGIAALAGVLFILFTVTVFYQFKTLRQERRQIYSQVSQENGYNGPSRIRQSIIRGARESFAPPASPLKFEGPGLPRPQIPRPPPEVAGPLRPGRVVDV